MTEEITLDAKETRILESMREMMKFQNYMTLALRIVDGKQSGIADVRVHFMNEVVPSEFVRVTSNGKTVSNEGILTFACHTFSVRLENSNRVFLIPFTYAVEHLITVNGEGLRQHYLPRFESKTEMIYPNNVELFATTKLGILQIIRNVLMLPLNTMRAMWKQLTSKHI